MRIKRSDNEIRQFGLPTLEERIIILERSIEFLMVDLGSGRMKDFDDLQAKMDQVDKDNPGKGRDS